jgi:hypothetical protein
MVSSIPSLLLSNSALNQEVKAAASSLVKRSTAWMVAGACIKSVVIVLLFKVNEVPLSYGTFKILRSKLRVERRTLNLVNVD